MRNLILAVTLAVSTSVMADTWRYEDKTNPMGDRTRYAALFSDNVLNLKFPYDAGRGLLMLHKSKYGNSLLLSTSGEPQKCSHKCSVRIRFDGAAPTTYSVLADQDSIFLNDAQAIALVKKAKKIIVEVELYRSGTQFMEFSVENELKEF